LRGEIKGKQRAESVDPGRTPLGRGGRAPGTQKKKAKKTSVHEKSLEKAREQGKKERGFGGVLRLTVAFMD